MGGLFSSFLGWFSGDVNKINVLPMEMGPEADVEDPSSTLTPRQLAYINATWALVKTDLRSHGVKLFILLFETYPATQSRFKSFETVPIEDLIDNKRLAAHATTVMTALDSYISNLDDIAIVAEMLEKTGANHNKRGITKKEFQQLEIVLLKYLGESLGPSVWTRGVEEAWEKLLKLVLSVIFSAYDQEE